LSFLQSKKENKLKYRLKGKLVLFSLLFFFFFLTLLKRTKINVVNFEIKIKKGTLGFLRTQGTKRKKKTKSASDKRP
jgi:hypothetical protein